MFRFVILALIPVAVLALDITKCQLSNADVPYEIKISGCDQEPCDLVRGKNVTMVMSYQAIKNIGVPRASVMATSFGITTPYDLPEDQADVCGRLDFGVCPIEKDDDFTYHLEMPVLKEYPITAVVLEFSIVDAKAKAEEPVACFRVKCQTRD